MKYCPQCTRTFSDEYNFCLDDGSTLLFESDAEKTIPFVYNSNEIPTADIPTAPVTRDTPAKDSSKWLFLLIGVLAVSLAAATVFIFVSSDDANSATRNATLSPDGTWAGDWNTEKTDFTATAKFKEINGEVSGQIVWTLKRTTNPKKIEKVGTSAVEYVEGNFNSQTKMLNLRGVRKDDPNEIVILDKYNLSLSENNQMLMGVSINGQFILKR